jgi:phenylacetate-coenzyme A ligase PaaK-like adenylate-forming protein
VELDCRSAMSQLAVEVEIMPDCTEEGAVQKRLEQSFQTALNLRVPVRLLPRGSLPRFEMKALRWAKITE